MHNYDFGERIYALRKAKGLSQKELGALLDVSNKAVSKWETGAAIPKTETIIKLASVLDVSVEELLSEKQNFNAKANNTFDTSSNQIDTVFLQNRIIAFEVQNVHRKYKKAKTYLICILCLFIITAILFSVLSFVNGFFNPYVQTPTENRFSISECIQSSILMSYTACAIYTGIVILGRLVKNIPGWTIALLCIFFPFTFLFMELSGLVMVFPEIIISIKTLFDTKKYLKAINDNSAFLFENTSMHKNFENTNASKAASGKSKKKSLDSMAIIFISIAIASVFICFIPEMITSTASTIINRDHQVREIYETVALDDKYSLWIFSTTDDEIGVAYLKNRNNNKYSYYIAYTAAPEIYFSGDNSYYIAANGKTEKVYFSITNDKSTIPENSRITEFTHNNETCYFYIIKTELKYNFGSSCGIYFMDDTNPIDYITGRKEQLSLSIAPFYFTLLNSEYCCCKAEIYKQGQGIHNCCNKRR